MHMLTALKASANGFSIWISSLNMLVSLAESIRFSWLVSCRRALSVSWSRLAMHWSCLRVLFQRVLFDDGTIFPELSADSYAVQNGADWWTRFASLEHLAIRDLAKVRFFWDRRAQLTVMSGQSMARVGSLHLQQTGVRDLLCHPDSSTKMGHSPQRHLSSNFHPGWWRYVLLFGTDVLWHYEFGRSLTPLTLTTVSLWILNITVTNKFQFLLYCRCRKIGNGYADFARISNHCIKQCTGQEGWRWSLMYQWKCHSNSSHIVIVTIVC